MESRETRLPATHQTAARLSDPHPGPMTSRHGQAAVSGFTRRVSRRWSSLPSRTTTKRSPPLARRLLPGLNHGEGHCQESQDDLGECIGDEPQREDVSGLPLGEVSGTASGAATASTAQVPGPKSVWHLIPGTSSQEPAGKALGASPLRCRYRTSLQEPARNSRAAARKALACASNSSTRSLLTIVSAA